MLATLLRELFTSERFGRIPEPDPVTDSDGAVSAFVRAGKPNGILSGVHAFYAEQACRMIRSGDRILDLGCGPASLLVSIAALKPDASFVGIDASAKMIATGNELVRRLAQHNIVLRVDDMTGLSSIESGSIDVVLSSMAMHHLSNTDQLRRCFAAIERVMVPAGRLFLSDFGRLNSLKSVEYFVRRAIPRNEPILERDYRASLRAAFSRDEFIAALSARLSRRISVYTTAVSPMMVVLMAPFPQEAHDERRNAGRIFGALPRTRRADYWQLALCLRLGGMPITHRSRR